MFIYGKSIKIPLVNKDHYNHLLKPHNTPELPQSSSPGINLSTQRTSRPNPVFTGSNCKEFNIYCDLEANNGRAFEMHILMIYDAEFETIIKSMPVLEYNKFFNTIARENEHAISIFKIQVVPGKAYLPIKIPIDDNRLLVNCMVFAIINDKNMPAKYIEDVYYETITSNNIIRKCIIGSLKKSKIFITRYGVTFDPA